MVCLARMLSFVLWHNNDITEGKYIQDYFHSTIQSESKPKSKDIALTSFFQMIPRVVFCHCMHDWIPRSLVDLIAVVALC